MIDVLKEMWEALTRPLGTWITSITTTAYGAVSYFSFPVLHDILSLLCMTAGGVSCLALARVHWRRGDLIEMQKNVIRRGDKVDDCDG